MKRNLNIIQIKGVKGIILAVAVVCCLIAGFIVFPGWVWMQLWNCITNYVLTMPTIGLFQGILLWAIMVTSYLLFRKERVVVCMKAPQGLSDEELKAVFADMKKQAQEDLILQAMIKAKEAEEKYKAQQLELNNNETETSVPSDNSNL